MPAFPVLYADILERIDAIDPVAYARSRNFLNGAVTYLSPYISRGVITLKQVAEDAIAKAGSFEQSQRLIQELAWREYFQRVWQSKGDLIESDLRQPQSDTIHSKMPIALSEANTGIEAVDAAIRELYSVGYMHNHLRMYTASIACNIAKAHWKKPAQWLYYHLLDGDVASNNCSWQWVAGAFSSKKYYCNQENINKYCGTAQTETYLDKRYEQFPLADIPSQLAAATDIELKTVLPETSLPLIDNNKPTLIYNSYNLDPLWRKHEDVNRILLLEPSHFTKYPVSNKVLDFIIALSTNIGGIQIYCGEFADLQSCYQQKPQLHFIFKEHPAFTHYEGIKDQRSWLIEEVDGYYPSFFKYWKKCEKYLQKNF